MILAGVDNLANFSFHHDDHDLHKTQWKRGIQVILHPNFHPTSKDAFFGYNDLALIVTEDEFVETPTVRGKPLYSCQIWKSTRFVFLKAQL